MAGAYGAGVVTQICKKLGPDYFDSVYCYSVGSTTGTFYVANQPETIETVWKNYVDGTKLINLGNLFRKRHVLDLEYLMKIFKSEKGQLDVDAVLKSKVDLKYCLINYYSGKLSWEKPTKNNIFELMNAACALPIAHGPVNVGKTRFMDPTFVAGGLPLLEEICKTHDEVLLVVNFPLDYKPKLVWRCIMRPLFPLLSYAYPKKLRAVFKHRLKKSKETLSYMQKESKIKLMAPDHALLNSGSDSCPSKIHQLLELGKKDFDEFLKNKVEAL